ncbi:hypothetical protein NL476_27950, partial [Klebsiella pneumoniae]|nr:hypothetical protein [Klebsiella pneumoniae]
KDLKLEVTKSTIKNVLIKNKLQALSSRQVLLLTKKHVLNRLKFTRNHCNWSVIKWKNILWAAKTN